MLRRHRMALPLVTSVVLAIVVVFVWASQQGYVSLRGQDCTDEGYNPTPTYNELVEEHGKTPYCAGSISVRPGSELRPHLPRSGGSCR